MSDMKLAVMGAGGRMGGALIREISQTQNAVVVAALDRGRRPGNR